ncbi:hypothetical protein FBUS_05704 [Fasciolopsis buskii]|uniref:Uncharacterized protein n=1 Tax=Fasciolopsis buskii TaxID=27845 RepID=A0A8E0S2X9_9TREM|nr:hypothetical protein FBUS_05704 [Fasciolopsis buski]
MQRRPLTRIDYGLQDIIELKRYIDSRKAGETTKTDETKPTSEASHQLTEQEKRKQAVRQRIGAYHVRRFVIFFFAGLTSDT